MFRILKMGCGSLAALAFLLIGGIAAFFAVVLVRDAAGVVDILLTVGTFLGASSLGVGLLYHLWGQGTEEDDTEATGTSQAMEGEPGEHWGRTVARWVGRTPEVEASQMDRPWTAREEWAQGRITTMQGSLDGLGRGWLLFSFGSAFSLLGAVVSGVGLFGGEGAPPAWFGLPFFLLGVAMLVGASYRLLRSFRFGETVFEMETVPAALGGTLNGTVHTGVSVDQAPDTGFQVTVACYRHRNVEGKSDYVPLWRDEKQVKGQPSSKRRTLHVPISFALPSDQPPSDPDKYPDRIVWALELAADVSGVDYKAVLEVPVFEVEADSPENVEPSSEREREFEESESAGDRITIRHPSSGELEIVVGRGRPWMASAATISALGLATGSIVLFTTGTLAGVLLLVLAIGFGAAGYYYWTTQGRTRVDRTGIRIERGPLGFETTSHIPASTLQEVRLSPNGQAYDLHLVVERPDRQSEEHPVEGRDQEDVIVAARSISDRRDAEHLASQIEEAAVRRARYE